MSVSNAEIAAVFEEIADILELEQANPFRVRANRNATRVVQAFAPDIVGLSQPERLDLEDPHCRETRDAGVSIAISSDARSALDFPLLRFGIGQARRGWLEAKDVLNSRPLSEVRSLLKR